MTAIWRSTLTLVGATTLTFGMAHAQSPELSDPPGIEGEVVADHGSHTLRMGIGLAESSPQFLSSKYFGEILEQRTDGRITVNVFPNSQLGDDVQMLEMLQTGTLDMTYPSSSAITGYVAELAAFDLPFLLPSREAAVAVMQSDVAQGMLDANPTPMAFGELFSAMEQGVVDGQENPWSTILTSNFNEVQDYGTETRHVYTPFIMMLSERTWDRMAPEYQELVLEAARQSADYEIQLSAEYDDWSRDQLEERGMQITRLNDEQLAAFQEAVQPVYAEWAPRIGEDLIADIQQIVEDSSN